MNYVELFINEPTNAQLDMDQAFDIALQYSIADIKDITKRNSAYSKTITLPGTKNNNFWLGNLFDINADFTAFNPNRKTSAKILVNSEVVINGFLQLKKIKKLVNVDHQGNNIQYEVVVFNNAVDLMTELGEKLLNQVNLTDYEHTYSKQNIIDSWSHSYVDGYVYPMYGDVNKDVNYKVENFYPAIFYRTLLDGIFKDAGYGWTGSLANNIQFNKEIIPYVGESTPKLGEIEKERRLFRAGRTQSYNSAGLTFPVVVSAVDFTNSNQVIQLNNDSTSPNFDNDNHWNIGTYEWTCDANGKYAFTYNVRCDFTVTNTSPGIAYSFYTQPQKTQHLFWLEQFVNGNWSTIADSQVAVEKTYPLTINSGNQVVQNINVNKTSAEVYLYEGAKVRLRTRVRKTSMWSWASGPASLGTQVGYLALPSIITFYPGDTYLENRVTSTTISQGDRITWSSILSEKMKQKDIITDLIKRYNLFISVDPSNDRMLILDTRDNFYARGAVLDWTKKKDYSSEDNIELLSELQFKTMLLSYKPDTDPYNVEYTSQTSDVWGQYKYTFDNDFVKGENKIESPFSPTPIVKTLFGAFVPAINADAPKVQPRVLIWGGRKQFGVSWNFLSFYTVLGLSIGIPDIITGYPYAGHLDDPISPTLDNNFGTIKYPFYSELQSITNNNMFNNYWSNYASQIEEGRLVTSKFYLNEADVRYIKDNFNTKIFILDSYYYVNKIKDYKPLKNQVTEVELLKIKDGVRWTQKARLTANYNPINNIFFKNNGNNGAVGNVGIFIGSENISGGTIVATNSNVKPALNFAVGNKNNIFSTKSMIIGDENILNGEKSFILGGDNNTIDSDKSFVITGDENIIKSGSVINGSNNILSGDGGMIINGTNNTLSGNNVISIGAFGLSSSESDTVFLGPSFSVSTIDGSMKINGITFSGMTFSGINGDGTTDRITKYTGDTTIGTASIIDNGTQIIIDNDGSASLPTVAFSSANDTGFFFAYQHPFNNRFAITANGATAAIFTSVSTIISSLATIPGSDKRNVTVDGVGNLSATSSIGVGNGTQTSPSIYFNSDTDTGIYRPTTNSLSVAVGGSQSAVFTGGGVSFPYGIRLQSPDGTLWQISINNAGVITTAALG